MRLLPLALLALAAPALAQRAPLDRLPENTSGAPMPPEQEAVDVTSYTLAVAIRPAERTIGGTLTARMRVVHPTPALVFDLDAPYIVSAVTDAATGTALAFDRDSATVRVHYPRTLQPGETAAVTIAYDGAPRVAPRPPWVGGFTWSETADGQPWVGVSVQGEGADLWWPTKDHPSDKPDSVTVALTVPRGLTAVANGRMRAHRANADGTDTFVWHVSNPIANYGVSAYVAPYTRLDTSFVSVTGETVPVAFWVLPEHRADAARQLPEFVDHLVFLEHTFGPYPFRRDGYQIVHAPYLGMEHQSAIAYGDTFDSSARGFDWLHFHELTHEWWANLLTAADWRDFWVHESFAEYAEALYAGELARRHGDDAMAAYRAYLDRDFRPRLQNVAPVAPREPRSTTQMYFLPDGRFNGDIYFKGALFLNTLRWMLGDEAFLRTLHAIPYPTPASERTPGCACRFVSTEDIQSAFETAAGHSLAGVFDVYLRQPALPRLETARVADGLRLAWAVPDGSMMEGDTFDVPVEVETGGRRVRVEMPGGEGFLPLAPGAAYTLDPDGWVLRAPNAP